MGLALVRAGRLTREASNMTEVLVGKTCTPCRGGIPPLTREQAEFFHAQAPDWQLGRRYEVWDVALPSFGIL